MTMLSFAHLSVNVQVVSDGYLRKFNIPEVSANADKTHNDDGH